MSLINESKFHINDYIPFWLWNLSKARICVWDLMTSYFRAWSLTPLSFICNKWSIIVLKKAFPLWNPIRTRSFTKMEHQEAQVTTVLVAEFNDVKKETGLLRTWCLRWWGDSRAKLLHSRTRFGVPSNCFFVGNPYCPESVDVGTFCSNYISRPVPQFDHTEILQYKEDNSGRIDRETKNLERQLKQMKGRDSLGSANFNDFCFIPIGNSLLSLSVLTLKNTTERVALRRP